MVLPRVETIFRPLIKRLLSAIRAYGPDAENKGCQPGCFSESQKSQLQQLKCPAYHLKWELSKAFFARQYKQAKNSLDQQLEVYAVQLNRGAFETLIVVDLMTGSDLHILKRSTAPPIT